MVPSTGAPPPWKRKNPKQSSTNLPPGQRAEARERAPKAGRRYPNLVDDLAVAAKKRAPAKKR